MKKYTFLLLAITILSGSCSRVRDIEFPQTKHLTAEKIPMGSILLPAFMTLKQDMLVISRYKGDSVLYFYSRPDLKYLGSTGKTGEGPGDFIKYTMFCENTSDELIVNNLGSPIKLKQIVLDSLFHIAVEKEFKLSRFFLLNDMFMKNDSLLFYFDRSGIQIKKYDLAKQDFTGEITIHKNDPERGTSFHPDMGIVVYNDSVAVYLYQYQNRIDIFDLESMELKKQILAPGETHIDKNSWEQTNTYYLSAYAGKKYFYAVNVSRQGAEKEKYSLLVFDYDGNPVAEYSFDINLYAPFVVDEENGYIYSYNSQYEDYLLRYKL